MVKDDAAGAPDFTDQKGAKVWLRTQPRKVCVAIAARAALRVLPLVGFSFIHEFGSPKETIVSSSFRATSAAWFAIWQPNFATDVVSNRAASAAEAAASAAAATAFDAADNFSDVLDTADAVATAFAASAAADAVGFASASTSAEALDAFTAAAEAADSVAFAAASVKAAAASDAVILGGVLPGSLARAPLWPDGPPEWAQSAWTALKSHLLAADEGWEVWTDWYEARLRGDPFDPDLERARVLIDEAIWRQGPKAVNAEIARLIAAHRVKPEMPEERPAPVHFGFRDGALRPEPAPAPTPPAEQAAALRSAWAALGAMIEDFTTDGGGAQVRGLQATLRRCRAAMGAEFGALDVVLLGVHHSVVFGYARRADDILIPEDAGRLQAIDAQLGVFLAWFPEWSAYQASIAPAFAPPEVEQQAVADASAALDAIASAAPDLISPEAQEALAPLRDAATPEPSADDPNPVAPAAQRRGYLRSARSALRALAQRAITDCAAGVSKGLQKWAESNTVAALTTAQAMIFALAAGAPLEFGFLAGVVTYLARMIGRSDPPKGS